MEAMTHCVVYTAKQGQRDAFVQEVFSGDLLKTIRGQEGCQTYDFYLSEESDERIMLMETWESNDQREKYLTQPPMQKISQLVDHYIEDIEIIG